MWKPKKLFRNQDDSRDHLSETRVDCFYPLVVTNQLPYFLLHVNVIFVLLIIPVYSYLLLVVTKVTLSLYLLSSTPADYPYLKFRCLRDKTRFVSSWPFPPAYQRSPDRAVPEAPPSLQNGGLRSLPPQIQLDGDLWRRSPLKRTICKSGQFSMFSISFICSANIYWACVLPRHSAG